MHHLVVVWQERRMVVTFEEMFIFSSNLVTCWVLEGLSVFFPGQYCAVMFLDSLKWSHILSGTFDRQSSRLIHLLLFEITLLLGMNDFCTQTVWRQAIEYNIPSIGRACSQVTYLKTIPIFRYIAKSTFSSFVSSSNTAKSFVQASFFLIRNGTGV